MISAVVRSRLARCTAAALALWCAAGAGAIARADDVPCAVPTPSGSATVAPFVPSDDQRKELLDTLGRPAVIGVRKNFDAAVAGKPLTPTAGRTLAGVPASLLRDRFGVMSVNRGEMGGEFITLLFRNHPDALYQVWVYDLGGGAAWELRAFSKVACTPAQMRYVDERYGSSLEALPGA